MTITLAISLSVIFITFLYFLINYLSRSRVSGLVKRPPGAPWFGHIKYLDPKNIVKDLMELTKNNLPLVTIMQAC